MSRPGAWLCVPVVALVVTIAPHAQSTGAAVFPGRLDEYLRTTLKLSAAEQHALLGGAPVTRMLPGDPAAEVGVFGAVWIAAPLDIYLRAVTDIETFERGANFRVTKKIADPATLADFAALTLPAEDVEDLKRCTVGDCEIKLSKEALTSIRDHIDWSRPTAQREVEARFRQIAVDYVTAYRRGGNAELAVYRDRDRPTLVAQEFADLVAAMPELTDYLGDVRRYLLEFPKFTPAGTTSFLYWQEAVFGLKPTIRFNHLAIFRNTGGAVVASKQLYASHYFWTALELRVLVPHPARGTGFWFVNINRSRSDGLSGFVGRLLRGKVRTEAENGMKAVLNVTKQSLEHQQRDRSAR